MKKLPNASQSYRHSYRTYRASQDRRNSGITARYIQGRERILGRGGSEFHASRLLDSPGGIREALAVLREVYNGRRSL